MTRARRPFPSFLVLACLSSSACDDDMGVEEVDRGAKPIEARRYDDVEIDAVRLVLAGTVEDTAFAMVTSEDGTPLCAVAGEGTTSSWVDVDALVEGRIERIDACPSDADATAMLQHLVAR